MNEKASVAETGLAEEGRLDPRIVDIVRRNIKKLLPPPDRPAWQWAEEKRVFPSGHGYSGPYRSDITPWVREITERVRSQQHEMIVMCCGSQLAKTDGVLMNLIGWKLDENPEPVLYIGPTEKNVVSVSRDRLAPMLASVPSLEEALMGGKADTITAKYVNGVRVGLGWAGSATEAASHSVALAIVDEYDRMRSLRNEGDIVGLVTPRIASYIDGKVVVTSTPLAGDVDFELNEETGIYHWKFSYDVQSPTWSLWQSGTRHEWAWPCPHCGDYFVPRMELLSWPDDATPIEARHTAFLICPCCGSQIDNEHKYKMNLRGAFVAPGQSVSKKGEVHGEEGPNPMASFWVSGLASNFNSNDFGNLAYKKLIALNKREDAVLQTVVNTGFGECFKPVARDYSWEKVVSRSSEYSIGEVPQGVKFLVMGSDLADQRIDWVIRGFGDDLESWLIDRGELTGQTSKPEVFRDLERVEQREYAGLKVLAHAIDSGYRPDNVYEYVTKDPYIRHATKGEERIGHGVQTKMIKDTGIPLTRFSTDMAKSWVHARLDWGNNEKGGWHVPEGIDRGYCKQIVAERRTVNRLGKPVWKRFSDNHKLDCEALCYIMAREIGPMYLKGSGGRPVAKRRVRRMISRGIEI